MNTRMWQTIFAATLLVARAAEPPTPVSTNAPPAPATTATTATNVAPATAVAPTATNVPDPALEKVVAEADAALTNAEPPKVIRTPNLSLPPLLDQVVRMAERGTDESVLKAYIDSAPAYRITGNDIIQLQDVGVSQSVILALIQRSKDVAPSSAPAMTDDSPAVSDTPPTPSSDVATTVVQPPATPPEDFYNTLSPYGTWYDVPGYGQCWQPTVVVVNRSWRPYCDYGNWLWSDYGWYWNSYYSWGAVPFHYGRWFSHPGRGWLWCPDRVWGPAWVTWRTSGSYCGWGPLPPFSHFVAGVGWTYRGLRVGAHFDFGLRHHSFTFVHRDRFASRHVGRSAIAARDSDPVFRGSSIANNHSLGADRRIINHGVPRASVGGAPAPARRSVSIANLNSRNPQPSSALANINRAAPAVRTAPAGRSSLAARSVEPSGTAGRSAVAPSARSATPSVGGNVNVFGRRVMPGAPNANAFARRAAPAQPSVRQSSPVQIVPRQSGTHGINRVAPQPFNRVAPSPVQRFGGQVPMRSAPSAQFAPRVQQMPRYSAPAAAPRQFAPGPSRSFGSGPAMGGGASRGSIAPRGNFGGGGGGARGGGGPRR